MRISVIGCGYLGAVHAAALCSLGHTVVGVDIDAEKVALLRRGEAPIFEPGLAELLRTSLETGRLSFTTDIAEVAGARVHFVAVGTPQSRESGAADMSYVDAAIVRLVPHLHEGDLVVGKSTVPVGTAARLAPLVAMRGAELAWNPEFLREGHAIDDTVAPDRLVYGVASPRAAELLDEVYASAVAAGTPVVVGNYETAELVKAAANAFLATKISFINAMAEIAETVGADVTVLADAIGHDKRIGRSFLNAGVGFGGGCLPKDIRAFATRAEELGRGDSVAFLKEMDAINLRRRDRVVQLVTGLVGGSVYRRRIAVLGLAFKPFSDDVRDSPALEVAVRLRGLGAEVVAYDPRAIDRSRALHPQLSYAGSAGEALTGADAVVLVTEWPEFRALDPDEVAALTAGRAIVDARNVLDAAAWRAAGWTYAGLGRP